MKIEKMNVTELIPADYNPRKDLMPGDIVLDPFGGSGSTLIACEQTGRLCRIVELDPVYADVIIKRWEELTGMEAIQIA